MINSVNGLVLIVLAIPFDSFKIFGFLSASNFLILVLGGKSIMRIMLTKRRMASKKSFSWLLIFIILVILSSVNSQLSSFSIRLLFSLIGMTLLTFITVDICRDEKSYTKVVNAIFVAAFIVCIVATKQSAMWFIYNIEGNGSATYYLENFERYVLKVQSLAPSSLLLAFYLITPTVLGVYCLSARGLSPRKIFNVFVGIYSLIILVHTFSKAGFLVIFLFIFYYAFVRLKDRIFKNKVLVFFIFFIIAGGCLSLAPKFFEFISNMGILSVWNRLSIIYGSWHSILDHPFLGKGIGSMVMPEFWSDESLEYARTLPHGKVSADLKVLRETHNTFLQIGVDTGLLGLFAYIMFLFRIYRESIKIAYTGKIKNLLKGILAAWVLTNIFSVSISVLFNKQLWLLAGLLIAGNSIQKRKLHDQIKVV